MTSSFTNALILVLLGTGMVLALTVLYYVTLVFRKVTYIAGSISAKEQRNAKAQISKETAQKDQE